MNVFEWFAKRDKQVFGWLAMTNIVIMSTSPFLGFTFDACSKEPLRRRWIRVGTGWSLSNQSVVRKGFFTTGRLMCRGVPSGSTTGRNTGFESNDLARRDSTVFHPVWWEQGSRRIFNGFLLIYQFLDSRSTRHGSPESGTGAIFAPEAVGKGA